MLPMPHVRRAATERKARPNHSRAVPARTPGGLPTRTGIRVLSPAAGPASAGGAPEGERTRVFPSRRDRSTFSRGAVVLLLVGVALTGCTGTDDPPENGIVADWIMSELLEADSPAVSIRGAPRRVSSPWGDAVAFDGERDAIFLDYNPLAGRDRFTVEVVMRPDGDGPPEQRYLHFGEANGDRVLLETRVTPDRQWYHDSYVQSGGSGLALIDPTQLHPTDEWYHVALVFDRGSFAHYIDGRRELEGSLEFTPLPEGMTSIGVRMNEVHWYQGEFHRIRISDRPLRPDEFMSLPPRDG